MINPPQTRTTRLTAWFMRRTTASAVRRIAPLNASIASDVGTVRNENQDRVALVHGADLHGSPFILAVLADGIGGMKQGAECAALTLATFIETLIYEAQQTTDSKEWVKKAAYQANQVVYARQAGEGGSTLAAILFTKGQPAIWLSIGDSRVYHISHAKMTQLSRDDTLDGQLGKPIEGGRRSELLQFIGIGEGLEPHIDVVPLDLSGILLLMTDGVHFIDSDYLGKISYYAQDLGICARRFMELARMLGGPDNASVVALSVEALSEMPTPQIDSAYEVWDPFGELHVIFERNRNDLPVPSVIEAAQIARKPVKPIKRALPKLTHDDSAVGDKPLKPRSKSGRKVKRKEIEVDAEQKSPNETPQLLIEFPFKGS